MRAAPLTAQVITVSDRCAGGTRPDRSGPLARRLLASYGVRAESALIVADDLGQITGAVRGALAAGVDAIVLTGGTGLGPRDVTPEAVTPTLDKRLPGIAEAIRAGCRERVPNVDLSRIVAGTAGRCVVLALPGSPGAVQDALAVAGPLLGHAVALLRGDDHGDHGDHRAREETGASDRVVRCEVTTEVLDLLTHEKSVRNPGSGAVVTFAGVVRDQDAGRSVTVLEYQAHPSAQAALRDVARSVIEAFPDVTALALSHRIGVLRVGETALAVAVAAPHRAEAFAACARLVAEVKLRVPIWKRQGFTGGGDEWVGCP